MVDVPSCARETPKSHNFGITPLNKILPGLRSRWIIDFECRKLVPAAMPMQMESKSDKSMNLYHLGYKWNDDNEIIVQKQKRKKKAKRKEKN